LRGGCGKRRESTAAEWRDWKLLGRSIRENNESLQENAALHKKVSSGAKIEEAN